MSGSHPVLSCLLTDVQVIITVIKNTQVIIQHQKVIQLMRFFIPEASGTLVLDSDVAKVDYSNTNQGYVMAF